MQKKNTSTNEWNASRLIGQARKPELGSAFGASLITRVRPKNVDRHFFIILAKKWQSPGTKIIHRKNQFWDFQFKVRFETSLIDSDQKIFSMKIIDFDIFHYFEPFGRKTTESEEKNFTREKIFDF